MDYKKFLFWLVITLYWCRCGADEEEMISDKQKSGNLKSSLSFLTESLSMAVNSRSELDFIIVCKVLTFLLQIQLTLAKEMNLVA